MNAYNTLKKAESRIDTKSAVAIDRNTNDFVILFKFQFVKVQIYFFVTAEFERAAKIRKIAVAYRFLISLLVPEL